MTKSKKKTRRREPARMSVDLKFRNAKEFEISISADSKYRSIGLHLGKVKREHLAATVVQILLETVDNLLKKED